MPVPRWMILVASAAAALVAVGAALSVGPWPGLAQSVPAPSGDLRYTATSSAGSTVVRAVRADGTLVASATFAGAYGIPAVTSTGIAGGLSPDGRLLVLAEPPNYNGLRTRSRFLLISTGTLSLASRIVLKGEFGFDALSPNGRMLYVIQHASSADLVSYVVRAYDLRTKRLLRAAIVDTRTPDETMRGYPVSRATSAGGSWVYTLYNRDAGKPFVHALNAVKGSAFCIDIPWVGLTDGVWNAHLELVSGGRQLVVRSASGVAVATVDTDTLTVRS